MASRAASDWWPSRRYAARPLNEKPRLSFGIIGGGRENTQVCAKLAQGIAGGRAGRRREIMDAGFAHDLVQIVTQAGKLRDHGRKITRLPAASAAINGTIVR